MRKHAPPVRLQPRNERQEWTYWISRDSTEGELRGACHLWYGKPERKRDGVHVMWQGPYYIGEYSLDDIRYWFNVVPDTDLELIRCETYATESQLKELAKR